MEAIRVPLVVWQNCIAPYLGFISLVRLRCSCTHLRKIVIKAIPWSLQTKKSKKLFGKYIEYCKELFPHDLPLTLKHLTLYKDGNVSLNYLTNLKSLTFADYTDGFEEFEDSDAQPESEELRYSDEEQLLEEEELTSVETCISDLPESLEVLRLGKNVVSNLHLSNLRELYMRGAGICVEKLFITKLDVDVLPKALPQTLEHLSLNIDRDIDLRHLRKLHTVRIKGDWYRFDSVVHLSALKKFTIQRTQKVDINFDTSQLECLKVVECFHPHLYSKSLRHLVTWEADLDLSPFPNLVVYKGRDSVKNIPKSLEELDVFTVPADLSYTNLKKLKYEGCEDYDKTPQLPPTIKSINNVLGVTDVLYPITELCVYVHTTIPQTVEKLTLVNYWFDTPHLPNLRKLILQGGAPPNLPEYVDTLVIRHIRNVNLSLITVRKLVVVDSTITAFPKEVSIFKYDKTTEFPRNHRLDLLE